MVLDEAMEAQIAEILRASPRCGFDFDEAALRGANRKQAMVPEGAIPSIPSDRAGLVVPAGDRVVTAFPGLRASCSRCGRRLSRDRIGPQGSPVPGDPASRLHDADVWSPRSPDRTEPAGDGGGRH